ncbi:MAG: peptidylprolyl isomerase [Chlorobiales bacterium]
MTNAQRIAIVKHAITTLLWLVPFSIFAQAISIDFFNSDFLEIKRLADERNAQALVQAFGKSDALDEAILISLGSVQDDGVAEAIAEKLDATSEKVRIAACFALGQTLRDSPKANRFEQFVIEHIEKEKNRRVKSALIVSLGVFGTRAALDEVARVSFKETALQEAQAEAIARFAIRQIFSVKGVETVANLYKPKSRGMNWCIYALARIPDGALLSGKEALLCRAAESPNANERMFAVTALSRVRSEESFAAVVRTLGDTDWRVAVNAIRALQGFAMIDAPTQEKVITELLLLLSSPNYHIARTSLETLARIRYFNPAEAERRVAPAIGAKLHATSPDLSATALRSLAQAFPTTALSYLYDMKARGDTTIALFEAIGIIAERERLVREDLLAMLLESLSQKNSKRATVAAESLIKIWKLVMSDARFESALLSALNMHSNLGNSSAVQAIASGLSDSLVFKQQYSQAFLHALACFKSSDNAETVIALLDALKSSKADSVAKKIEPYLSDESNAVRRKAAEVIEKIAGEKIPVSQNDLPKRSYNLSDFARFKKNPIAVVTTQYGEVEIELFLKETPFTVMNFVTLAERNFFDGLVFHRVVSNFVVQGGDPKGDGTGGAEQTIRSEFSPRSFERGTLGMASAGKDTESSQWFIMHAHQPHLDGRYTLFGKVLRGMESIDRLEQGDTIQSVRIEKR